MSSHTLEQELEDTLSFEQSLDGPLSLLMVFRCQGISQHLDGVWQKRSKRLVCERLWVNGEEAVDSLPEGGTLSLLLGKPKSGEAQRLQRLTVTNALTAQHNKLPLGQVQSLFVNEVYVPSCQLYVSSHGGTVPHLTEPVKGAY